MAREQRKAKPRENKNVPAENLSSYRTYEPGFGMQDRADNRYAGAAGVIVGVASIVVILAQDQINRILKVPILGGISYLSIRSAAHYGIGLRAQREIDGGQQELDDRRQRAGYETYTNPAVSKKYQVKTRADNVVSAIGAYAIGGAISFAMAYGLSKNGFADRVGDAISAKDISLISTFDAAKIGIGLCSLSAAHFHSTDLLSR